MVILFREVNKDLYYDVLAPVDKHVLLTSRFLSVSHKIQLSIVTHDFVVSKMVTFFIPTEKVLY